ncbi:hypothetical protein RRG08_012271 [Elysia crispata]|uniref:Uncharacterized protein n=1 Tax=Elysia crispata TaxID=231223 RepID=A0AAE1ECR2_9GAST|nr:hypothetical protein RRG08_012271 [Elysia crispata]
MFEVCPDIMQVLEGSGPRASPDTELLGQMLHVALSSTDLRHVTRALIESGLNQSRRGAPDVQQCRGFEPCLIHLSSLP